MFSNKVRSLYRFEARLLSTSSGKNMALQKGGEGRAATVGSKEYDEASTIHADAIPRYDEHHTHIV